MDKIKDVAYHLGIITVEDMERYTALELIMMIANKLTETQKIVNEHSDEIQYLLNEGLESEVIQKFNEWLEDGTLDTLFDTLINQTALKKVNNRIDETNAQLSQVSNQKLDKNGIVTMSNMGQDVKEAMTGGGVAVVGVNTILEENIIAEQVTISKTNFIYEGINIFNKNNARVENGYYNASGYNDDYNYKTITVKVKGSSTISISKVYGYLTEIDYKNTTTQLHGNLGNIITGYTFTTNENTTALKITLNKSWSLDEYMIVYGSSLPSHYVKYEPILDSSIKVPYALKTDLSNLEKKIGANDVDFITASKNRFDKNNFEKGVYYRNGSDKVYDSVYSTISFKCEPNKQYTSSKAFGYITFWKNGEYVSNIAAIGDQTNYTFSSVECDEVKITIKTSENLNTFMVVEGSEMPSQYVEYGYSFNLQINGIQDNKNVYLFGWFGQSNADGRGTNTKPSNISDDVILLKDNGSGGVTATFGNNINDNASSIPYFAKWLNILSGKKIAIAKWCLGGTSLIPDSNPSWNPDTTDTNYYNSAKTLYQNAITYLEGLGYNVVKVGFVWTQGENEGESGANNKAIYKSVLKSLISSFRSDLGINDFKCFVNLLGAKNVEEDKETDKFQYIRQAQQEVVDEDTNVFVISDCAKHFVEWDMGYMKDDLHYNDSGYILLGKQGAEYTYLNVFNETHNSKYKLKNDNEY